MLCHQCKRNFTLILLNFSQFNHSIKKRYNFINQIILNPKPCQYKIQAKIIPFSFKKKLLKMHFPLHLRNRKNAKPTQL